MRFSFKHSPRKNIEALVNEINTAPVDEDEREDCEVEDGEVNESDDEDSAEEESPLESQANSRESADFLTPIKVFPIFKQARVGDIAATKS